LFLSRRGSQNFDKNTWFNLIFSIAIFPLKVLKGSQTISSPLVFAKGLLFNLKKPPSLKVVMGKWFYH